MASPETGQPGPPAAGAGARARRRRPQPLGFQTWLVLVSVVAYVGVAVAFIALAAHQAAISKTIRDNQVAACRGGNKVRTEDIAIWNRLLKLPPEAHPTKAQQAEIRQLAHLVKVKDNPVNCAALYRVP